MNFYSRQRHVQTFKNVSDFPLYSFSVKGAPPRTCFSMGTNDPRLRNHAAFSLFINQKRNNLRLKWLKIDN